MKLGKSKMSYKIFGATLLMMTAIQSQSSFGGFGFDLSPNEDRAKHLHAARKDVNKSKRLIHKDKKNIKEDKKHIKKAKNNNDNKEKRKAEDDLKNNKKKLKKDTNELKKKQKMRDQVKAESRWNWGFNVD